MRKALIICTGILFAFTVKSQENPSGYYMGQIPPGDIPQIFAPGFISTGEDELFGTFSYDLKEFYFIKACMPEWRIMVSRYVNGVWTVPSEAGFSDDHTSKFCLSPDGSKAVITSLRPGQDISPGVLTTTWISNRSGNLWSQPQYIPGLDNAFAPSLSNGGDLYFYKLGESQQDIYVSRNIEGKYSTPERLGLEVNSVFNEADPWIAPDESYLLFSREEDGSTGLFISYQTKENLWTEAIPLGKEINNIRPVNAGSVSPDGKYIFLFSNYKHHPEDINCDINKPGMGSIDIYWVSSDIINRMRPAILRTEVFKPGKISIENRDEGNLSHSSKYNTFIYRVFDPEKKDPLKLITYSKIGLSEIINHNICIDGDYREWDFNFDRRGRQFYFTSDRPLGDYNYGSIVNSKIWKVAYRNGIWGEPLPLPPPVNLNESFSGYPAFTDNGLMYFHSNRPGGYGGDDIYTCISSKNLFTQLFHPAYPINTGFNDRDPAVSPDGSVLIFFSDRPGGSYTDGDLYICSRNKKGNWDRPMPLGGLIGYAGHPYISDDGDSLFFTGISGSDTDIYKVSLDGILEHYSRFIDLYPVARPEPLSEEIFFTADDEIPVCLVENLLVFSRTQEGYSDWLNEPIYISYRKDNEWSTPLRITNNNGNWYRYLPLPRINGRLAIAQHINKSKGKTDLDIKICEFISPDTINLNFPGHPVNTEFTDSWPVLDLCNNLYFFSSRPGGQGDLDLYYSIPEHNHYNSAKNMGYPVNTGWREHDPAISPDGTILVFTSNRVGGFGGDDLYFCFRLEEGSWSAPFNLGPEINSEWDENRPLFSHDGRFLLFSSNMRGNYDIYKLSVNLN